jgi:1,2-diacylglycerol 3-beta-glucosyltransferase
MIAPLQTVLGTVLMLAALPVVFACGYLALLALLARRGTAPPPPPPRLRFDVVVPAHNEELGIQSTVASLLALDYPRELYRVVVVADNCTDRTAELARGAGARLLERRDSARRGKGYALAYAYAASVQDRFADAVVVVDADSIASPNLLSAMGARFAAGEEAVQACYGVRNVSSSWRAQLMAVAFACFHDVRSLARERLGLSCGLRGNGMGFTRELLRRVPHAAYSVVEDLEYGIQLGYAGVRVAFAAEAHVLGEMPASAAASRTQRDRWEAGRRGVKRAHVVRLLYTALVRRDRVALDLALDLLVPSLSTLVIAIVTGTAASLLALRLGYEAAPALTLWGASLLALTGYVAKGCTLVPHGARTLAALARAPYYVAWKVAVRLRPSQARQGNWVRTSRATECR